MTRTLNAWSLQPDGGLDRDVELSATCLCGHAADAHGETGCWNDGPCEIPGCPCRYFRRYDETEDEDGL